MINANEAKQKVEQGKFEKAEAQWTKIQNGVNHSVSKGYFDVSFSEPLIQSNRERLKALGYKVSEGAQYNESYFTISWK